VPHRSLWQCWLSLPLSLLLCSSPVSHTLSVSLSLSLSLIFSPSHKYCNLHINEPGRSVEQECNSYFLLLAELLFLHFDFFCALLLLTPHPFLPVSLSQKKPMLAVRGLNNTISLRAVPNMWEDVCWRLCLPR